MFFFAYRAMTFAHKLTLTCNFLILYHFLVCGNVSLPLLIIDAEPEPLNHGAQTLAFAQHCLQFLL